jgi:hypothetical protein
MSWGANAVTLQKTPCIEKTLFVCNDMTYAASGTFGTGRA